VTRSARRDGRTNSSRGGRDGVTASNYSPRLSAVQPALDTVPPTDADASLACVILAHTDPVHVRRLIAALDPFPVFLHCDASTPDEVFAAMATDLPARCTVLERISTGWARWGIVAAELEGYRAALDGTDATHVALMQGSDYPLASTAAISATLEGYRDRSIAMIEPLPYLGWGRSGGFARLRYRHWAYRRHMLRLPVPRRLPTDVVPAGGSALKILARDHARAVVDAADTNPRLVRFWRRSWCPDETFVPSILSTPRFVPGWSTEHVQGSLWWIGWDGSRQKSPPWLDLDSLDRFRDGSESGVTSKNTTRSVSAARGATVPKLFARKFSTERSAAVLDAIDAQLRTSSGDRA